MGRLHDRGAGRRRDDDRDPRGDGRARRPVLAATPEGAGAAALAADDARRDRRLQAALGCRQIPIQLSGEGYPPDLETLVKGVQLVGKVDKKEKFLRRIPIDPMTGKNEWGMRAYQDENDSFAWGGRERLRRLLAFGRPGLGRLVLQGMVMDA